MLLGVLEIQFSKISSLEISYWSMWHFRLCILRRSKLGLDRFPFQHVARKKQRNILLEKEEKKNNFNKRKEIIGLTDRLQIYLISRAAVRYYFVDLS